MISNDGARSETPRSRGGPERAFSAGPIPASIACARFCTSGAWAEKYRDRGLVVISVHAPSSPSQCRQCQECRCDAEDRLDYPPAIDNDYRIWRAFENQYWPAHYFIDANGRVRHRHFGEGEYAESERVIQTLLAEAGSKSVPSGTVMANASGAEAASKSDHVKSPETYIGYDRSENFALRRMSATSTSSTPRFNMNASWTSPNSRPACESGGKTLSKNDPACGLRSLRSDTRRLSNVE